MSDPSKIMKDLNEINWYYHVESKDGVYKRPIGDLDCIKINLRMQKLQNGDKINQVKKKPNLIYLPLSEITVDVRSMQAFFDRKTSGAEDERLYRLVKSPLNKRVRSKYSQKYINQELRYLVAPSDEVIQHS